MVRVIVGLVILAGVGLFVRHQYQSVIKQATTKSPNPIFPTSPRQESRIKCIMCNGTGRSSFVGFGTLNSPPKENCRSCKGMGWVDNPAFGR